MEMTEIDFGKIIIIIIISGVLGGLINFLLIYKLHEKWKYLLAKSVTLGIGASFLAPLFLKTISSNIMELTKTENPIDYLVFAGFCLIVSIFSKRFIEDLYSRVVKVEKDANEALAKANELEEIKSEDDNLDENIISKIKIENEIHRNFDLTDVKKVIDSIKLSNFSYRSSSGISKDLNMDKNKVDSILDYLKETGFTSKRLNNQGKEVWRLK